MTAIQNQQMWGTMINLRKLFAVVGASLALCGALQRQADAADKMLFTMDKETNAVTTTLPAVAGDNNIMRRTLDCTSGMVTVYQLGYGGVAAIDGANKDTPERAQALRDECRKYFLDPKF